MRVPWILAAGLSLLHGLSVAQNGVNPHGTLPEGLDCSSCHRTETWTSLLDPLPFDHDKQTTYALIGSHETATCTSCHRELRFKISSECADCHLDVHQAAFTLGCEDCHNTTSFTDVDADEIHNSTRFPLDGAHAEVACESCHGSDRLGAFVVDESLCSSCHMQEYDVTHADMGYPTTCESCHNTLAWSDGAAFEHATASGGFELLGSHKTIECTSCHAGAGFAPIFPVNDALDCAGCHLSDFEQQHGGAGYPTDCSTCHGTDAWAGATFDHPSLSGGFALVGAHDMLPCSACHAAPPGFEPLFAATSDQDCFTCHQSDYTQEHGGAGFPTTCQDCHGTDAWEGATFDHATVSNGFSLVGAHESLVCSSCHGPSPGFEPLFTPADENDCFTCHQTDYNEQHQGTGFPTTCADCHGTDTWEGTTFDHATFSDGYPLVGAHEALACSSCHGPSPDFEPLFTPADENDCFTCHQADYNEEHQGTAFPTTCAECHGTDTWSGATFDHATFSDGYPLVGAHEALACSSCHGPSPDFEPLFDPADENDCLTCHQADYNDEHAGTGFPTTCADCHGTDSWSGVTFDHVAFSDGYPLVGAHQTLACSSCHGPSPDFEPLFDPGDENDCLTCHQADYNEEHAGTGFPTTCLNCHGTDSWSGVTFDHVAFSDGYPLLGAHETLACASCHGPSPEFQPLFDPADENDCLTCHESDYNEEHLGTEFPTTCLDCHGIDSWGGVTFDHVAFSDGYPLVGAHEALACASCHGPAPGFEPLFAPADESDCFTCHQSDYNEEHAGTDYPTTCTDCHGTDTWSGSTFDHAALSNGFNLMGAHNTLACSSCHGPSPGFQSLFDPADENDCLTCHQADYNEEHTGTGFPTTCTSCHGIDSWAGVTFDHVAFSDGFALIGAHATLACASCHGPSPEFQPLFEPADENDCFTCHQSDYNQEHAGSDFPTTCTTCHGLDNWVAVNFDHEAFSDGYPLVGAHEALACSSCHGPSPGLEPLFDPANENDCFTCHQSDYNEEHAGSGYPTTCTECHGTDTWSGIIFDHASVADGYLLVGAHQSVSCNTCHGPSPDFLPLFDPADENDCATCHQPDYNEKHAGTGFPTTCIDCHGTDTWSGVTFDHESFSDGYPLVGAHQTLACSSCHGPSPEFQPLFNPANENDCVTCHQPDYDQEHAGTGYPTTCTDCHGTDAWTGATFDHAGFADGYALVGAHESLNCSSCHGPSPDFEPLFSPSDQNDCFTCHQADYVEEHAGTGFPNTCIDCHGTDTWTGATFDHASFAEGYALVGAHDALACSSCHGPSPGFEPLFNPSDQNDCVTCHQSDYNEQHAGTGFPTTCIDCHDADTWSGATFDHASFADGYALVGAHEALACSSCHGPSPGFEPLFNPSDQNDCVTCHQSDYNEQHAGTGFPTTCIDCHGTDTWSGATFDHASFADGYALVGAHEALVCSSCHGPSPGFEPLFNPSDQNDCVTCHQSDYNEQHSGTGFPTTCVDCHGTDTWSGATFDHASFADGYALVGAHEALACSSCHGPSPGFEPLFSPSDQNDCVTCHQADYNTEHSGSGFPTTCIDCHGTDTWSGATFDHASFADGYALVGAHEALACSSCHGPSPGFEPLFNPSDQNDCVTCHQADYNTEHSGTGFPTTCIDCHGTDTWSGATFDHATFADGYALVGAHEALACSSCHGPSPGFEPLFNPSDQNDCVTCHQADYNTEHSGTGFPTTCIDCHGTDTWSGATFDHATFADGYALVGAHEALACSSCHGPSPGFEPLFSPSDQNDCVTCHQADYNTEHSGSGFPTTCIDCHGTDTWQGASFDHATFADGYALVGAHEALACSSCHGPSPGFEPLFNPSDQNDCVTCHQADYNTEHSGSGFPTTCIDCHGTDTWSGATFDHATFADGYALVGAHQTLACSSCHGPSPGFEPLFNPSDENDCYTCHQTAYQSEHGAQGYPTTCLSCHNTTDWQQTDFNHDGEYFPIFSGSHQNAWTACQDCHQQIDDPSVFTCVSCHQHNQLDVDRDHSQVNDYVYESTACYNCHPNGTH